MGMTPSSSFLAYLKLWVVLLVLGNMARTGMAMEPEPKETKQTTPPEILVTLFLCGDVMTGRGIDQALPHPSDPTLHEPYMKSAKGYVEIAARAYGPIAQPVDFSYVWGEALAEWDRVAPDLRLINLETTVTKSSDYWIGKEVHYRMNPENIPCLTAAKIDVCALGNNHTLDWGPSGLIETLETLAKAKIKFAGAGRNLDEARAPAIAEIKGKGRVLVFSFGSTTSGVPEDWAAAPNRPGVNLLPDFSKSVLQKIAEQIRNIKQKGDIVVFSIHWGANWGYSVSRKEKQFAHQLIDVAGVDVIHGHSSHHVKGIEVYNGHLILYGCGDFLTDYEGIGGYETFRGDLGVMYFASVDPSTGKLARLQMTPTQVRNFRILKATPDDVQWLQSLLNREGKKFGTRVNLLKDHSLKLEWD